MCFYKNKNITSNLYSKLSYQKWSNFCLSYFQNSPQTMQNPKHTKKQAVSTIAVTGSAFWGKPYKTNGAKNVGPEIFLRDKIQN